MLSPLKTIFWMTLHTASALAATLILNLDIADALTEDTTSVLKHMQAAAVIYFHEKASKAIRTYGYQPTSIWEATVQDTIDTGVQLTQHPDLIVQTVILAVIAAAIRYGYMLYQVKKQHRPQRQSSLITAGRTLTLQRLLAKLSGILTINSTSTSCTRQKPRTRRQHANSWLQWLYKALQLMV